MSEGLFFIELKFDYFSNIFLIVEEAIVMFSPCIGYQDVQLLDLVNRNQTFSCWFLEVTAKSILALIGRNSSY